ncbi:helix-turn-helix domain-containing protein [Moraxella bovoculi]|uniref:helix-turn-helix domain-containing protein n=1 Tax=Moraxella bovoculi TaxID=386891 RepID=UPI0006248481|nr:helix-turn-helix transcriptional regulator [Moraxella bovoculi]AKG17662.1 XRE family transcriptional regulator [Moraxella bovoculi]ALT07576.1 XRE family transcriptional regulator [Moraxella bovoculi]
MILNKFAVVLAEKRLRVADVVRATGMSKSTLHKLYNDESSRIDFETIDKLCEFLEVNVGDLFEYKPNKQASTHGNE